MPSKRAGTGLAFNRGLIMLALAAALAAAFAGWSLVWLAAARQTGAVVASWMSEEGKLGRKWTCAERHIAGFPFDIEVSCGNLAFEGTILERRFAGALRGFRAAASVSHPDRIIARIDPPFAGDTRDGKLDFRLDWAKLDLTIDGGAEALARLALDGRQMSLKGSINGLWAMDWQARSVRASVSPGAGEDEPPFDFKIAINGAEAPVLRDQLGLAAPLDAAVDGTITKLDVSSPDPFVKRIERWRMDGGRVELRPLRLTSGNAKLEAQGGLDLDQERRPRGELDAALSGLDPILSRLGVDPGLLTAGALLTSLLGDSRRKGDAEATNLQLRVADGWISIGPMRTPLRVPPLY
jgi:hypothetical protein